MQQRWKKIDYTTPSGASGGPGVASQFGWYAGTPYIDMTAAQFQAVSATIGAKIGDVFWLGGGPEASGGNAFMFIRASAALTLGQLVAVAPPTAGTYTAAGSTSAAVVTNISCVAAGVNGEVNNWISIMQANCTTLQMRRIKGNNASATATFTVALKDYLRPNTPTDQDVFNEFATLVNGDVTVIIRPFHGIVNTASTIPIGVSLGAVTSGNYTLIQVAGLACVSSVGNVANKGIVTGQPLVGAAAGQVTGPLDNAATEYIKYSSASNVTALTTSTAASLLIPAYVNFLGV